AAAVWIGQLVAMCMHYLQCDCEVLIYISATVLKDLMRELGVFEDTWVETEPHSTVTVCSLLNCVLTVLFLY
ncbi:hypothetical protein FRX31_008793, partial [Thalictrum thalictroides]